MTQARAAGSLCSRSAPPAPTSITSTAWSPWRGSKAEPAPAPVEKPLKSFEEPEVALEEALEVEEPVEEPAETGLRRGRHGRCSCSGRAGGDRSGASRGRSKRRLRPSRSCTRPRRSPLRLHSSPKRKFTRKLPPRSRRLPRRKAARLLEAARHDRKRERLLRQCRADGPEASRLKPPKPIEEFGEAEAEAVEAVEPVEAVETSRYDEQVEEPRNQKCTGGLYADQTGGSPLQGR